MTQSLRKLPVTTGNSVYAFWQYEQAVEIEGITDGPRREARIAGGAVTLQAFSEAVGETPVAFYVNQRDDLAEARRALDAVSDAFAAHVGHDAPPAGGLRAILQAIADAIQTFAGERLLLAQAHAAPESADEPVEADAAPMEDTAASSAGGMVPAGKPVSREDAFRQLLRIAAFFRETEPHSPISYSLDEAVRRGRLSLPLLLDELIMDPDARRFFFIASGVRPPETAE